MFQEGFINHFANWWFLLALPLPLMMLAWHLWRHWHRPAVLYSDLSVAAGLPVTLKQRVLGLMPYTRALALCLGIVALARPQYGTVEYSASSLGVDIALSIDVSGSMQETDYRPNRLEAAKQAAIDFVDGRETDRVSVVVFGESAALLCPPTLDMDAAQLFIQAISDGMVGNQATAVGDGLALAVRKLEDSTAKSRVAILLTDGENNSGQIDPLKAGEIAKALGVKVYTIGLGRGGRGQQLPFLGTMMSNAGFNESTLKQIAEITGGQYFRASDEKSLQEIYDQIDRMEKSEIEVEETADYNERFMLFWFPGLALIGLEFLLRAFWLRRLP